MAWRHIAMNLTISTLSVVDAEHHTGTSVNVSDIVETHNLLHGDEEYVFADLAFATFSVASYERRYPAWAKRQKCDVLETAQESEY